jgi:hypothetical protein
MLCRWRMRPPGERTPKKENADAGDWQPALVFSRRDMDGAGGLLFESKRGRSINYAL